MMLQQLNIKKFLPITLVLALYLVFAFSTYKDFGITSDEFSSYISGQIWWEYFLNKPSTYNLARYNPLINEHYRIYSMVLYVLIGGLKYEVFHLFNLLAFIPVIVVAWLLSLKVTKNAWIACIPVLFILLTPRILGDIPANPKDMPFSVAYFVSLGLIFWLSSLKDKLNPYIKVIILGLVFGYAQSLRPLGFGLYPIYFIWSFLQLPQKNNVKSIFNLATETFTVLLVGLLFTTATWPAIGSNFVVNLKKYLSLGADYNLWEGSVLYFGKEYKANNLPLSYLFVWLGISLPIISLSFFTLGITSFKKLNPISIFIYLAVLFNLVLYLVLRPNLYNGIRHYSFLILLISFVAGLVFIQYLETINKKVFLGLISIFIVSALYLGFTMWKLHPLENIYFNEFISAKTASTNFDVDYWDTAYILAAQKFGQSKSTVPSNIYACGAHTALDYYLGKSIVQKKNAKDAEYIFCDVNSLQKLNYPYETLFTIDRNNMPLVVVAKVKN